MSSLPWHGAALEVFSFHVEWLLEGISRGVRSSCCVIGVISLPVVLP